MTGKHLVACLLISIFFILGIFLGSYYHDPIVSFIERIVSENQQQVVNQRIHYCPPAPLVRAHQYNPSPFEDDQVYWQMASQAWKAPQNIGFMQALVNDEHTLVCYYHWPNPKEIGTNLWLTVQLSPMANQDVKPYGLHWKMTGDNDKKMSICMTGINSCGVIVSPEPLQEGVTNVR